jgi:hypothetical protein
MQMNQAKGVELKMRECKLKSGINWQEALKQKGIKQMDIKEGLSVLQSFRTTQVNQYV